MSWDAMGWKMVVEGQGNDDTSQGNLYSGSVTPQAQALPCLYQVKRSWKQMGNRVKMTRGVLILLTSLIKDAEVQPDADLN